MERPTITINGNVIVMPEVKARVWREVMQLENDVPEIKKVADFRNLDAIDKICAVIAVAFGVSSDEVLDNLYIADVLPTYFGINAVIYSMLTEKLSKKNAEDTLQH